MPTAPKPADRVAQDTLQRATQGATSRYFASRRHSAGQLIVRGRIQDAALPHRGHRVLV